MYLYKYSNLENTKRSLKDSYIYMSSPENFNDIYDSILGYEEDKIQQILIGEICNKAKIGEKTYLELAKRVEVFSKFKTDTARSRYNFLNVFLSDDNFGFLKKFGEMDKNESIDLLVEKYKEVTKKELNKADFRAIKLMRLFNFQKFYKRIFSKNKVEISRILGILNSEELKISCLTEDNASNYMWALYADNFKGACLAYDYDILSDETANDIYKIRYNEIKPLITANCILDFLDDIEGSEKKLEKEIFDTITTKHTGFEKEREWRIIKLESGSKQITRSLKAIYLGYKISKKDMKFFKRASKRYNVDLFQLKVESNTYQICFKKI